MSEIKPVERFTCGNGGAAFCQGCYEMSEDEDGHYVEFAAYEALSGKYHELKARSEIDARTVEALQKENAALKEELDRERMRLTACGVAELEGIAKAVAHTGIDWGYGKFELTQDHIDSARALYESSVEFLSASKNGE